MAEIIVLSAKAKNTTALFVRTGQLVKSSITAPGTKETMCI